MNEIEGSRIQLRSHNIISWIRGIGRGDNRPGIPYGIYSIHRDRNYHVPVRICEIEPDINREVIDRANDIDEDELLHDEEVTEFFEENHLSELDRRITNMDKREMITVCCVAIRKYPLAYLQVIAQYITELTRKGRKTS